MPLPTTTTIDNTTLQAIPPTLAPILVATSDHAAEVEAITGANSAADAAAKLALANIGI